MKLYGARPERSHTIEGCPGQTAQEIVNDDTWDADDLVAAQETIAKTRKLAAKWRTKAAPEERGYAESYLGDCADELEATLKGIPCE